MAKPALLTLALVAATLAGCSAGTPPAAPTADPIQAEAVALGQTTLRFAGLTAPIEKTVWANGTVAAQDTCNTGACITDASGALHVTDITGDLPAGVPVEIAVAMSTTPSPLFGTFEVFLNAPESTMYYNHGEIDHASGTASVQAMLRPAGTVEVVLLANAPGGQVPATPYTLSIAISAGPERVPAGAPIGVVLGPGSNLTFQAPGQTKPSFLLYAPDDALLGSYAGNVTLPANAAKGEYVVLLPSGAQWGNLSSDTATAMRAVGLRTEFGPEGSLPPNGAYDGRWDVQGFPFAVGVAASSPPDATPVGGPLVSSGFEVSLIGANGFTLESGPQCGLCLTFGFGATFDSGTGNAEVVAQEYAVHAETVGVTYDLRVVPFARYLDRTGA